MVIYGKNSKKFKKDVDDDIIVETIDTAYHEQMNRQALYAEKRSWANSLPRMESVIRTAGLPDDCGILAEYEIPNCGGQRIDLIITGHDKNGNKNIVLIELKQWENTEQSVEYDNKILTFTGGSKRSVRHPCEQVATYLQALYNINASLSEMKIHGYSCAYLHNYFEHPHDPLFLPQFLQYINKPNEYSEKKADIFFKRNLEDFRAYLQELVGGGNGKDICHALTNGKIYPTEKFRDKFRKVFEENEDFLLLDEQRTAYEEILKYSNKNDKKHTVIIEGGPGTGKSIIGVNVLATLLRERRTNNICYVTPGASFRNGLKNWVTKGKIAQYELDTIFTSATNFLPYDPDYPNRPYVLENTYDTIIVDEAHRLIINEKSHRIYHGDNQVDDIIRVAKTSVFFIDEEQSLRPNELASINMIKEIAAKYGSEVHEVQLEAQYRCKGAVDFIDWIEHALQFPGSENKGNNGWKKDQFDFRILDSPQDVWNLIEHHQKNGESARLLAGFAWPWKKKNNLHGEIPDVKIPEWNFEMPWDGRDICYDWLDNPKGEQQIGCAYNVQGLEMDYAGVIIGNDLKYNPETNTVTPDYKEFRDNQAKANLSKNPELLKKYIIAAYRVLLSRGMKGCYLFCRDQNLQIYMKQLLHEINMC